MDDLGRIGSPKNTAIAPIRHTFSPQTQRESPKYNLGIKNFHMAVNHSVIGSGEVSRNLRNFATAQRSRESREHSLKIENTVHNMMSTRPPSGL